LPKEATEVLRDSIAKKMMIVVGLVLCTVLLVGFDSRPGWGDPTGRVWYRGELVPIGVLLDEGIEPHCHDALGKGIVTCYESDEELAAATGWDVPGTDKAKVESLRSTGVSSIQPAATYYAVVYEAINYGGRNFYLVYDYNDFRAIYFNDITSSISIPWDAGTSRYYAAINYSGDSIPFSSSVADLRSYNFNDVISSARKGY
jgi:hypothetical protein